MKIIGGVRVTHERPSTYDRYFVPPKKDAFFAKEMERRGVILRALDSQPRGVYEIADSVKFGRMDVGRLLLNMAEAQEIECVMVQGRPRYKRR